MSPSALTHINESPLKLTNASLKGRTSYFNKLSQIAHTDLPDPEFMFDICKVNKLITVHPFLLWDYDCVCIVIVCTGITYQESGDVLLNKPLAFM